MSIFGNNASAAGAGAPAAKAHGTATGAVPWARTSFPITRTTATSSGRWWSMAVFSFITIFDLFLLSMQLTTIIPHLEIKNIQSTIMSKSNHPMLEKVESRFALYSSSTLNRSSVENTIPKSNCQCPNVTRSRNLECGCDVPHMLRCSGDIHGLQTLSHILRESPCKVSLLDCTLRNVTVLNDMAIFQNVSLRGLAISSGEINHIHRKTFYGLDKKLQSLGLSGNALESVPRLSIMLLTSLERLDLSDNKIKILTSSDFVTFTRLNFLDLSNNEITNIEANTFSSLLFLDVLRLGINHLGESISTTNSIGECTKLRNLDVQSNLFSGALTNQTFPKLRDLEDLNLERNYLKRILNRALTGFPRLKSLILSHNQIDIVQDHAFFGLDVLEVLNLSFNGIVAVSSASFHHLRNLKILNLTHNFLRTLTNDLIPPAMALESLLLSDNDISIVETGALDTLSKLKIFSLEENPLACDCNTRYISKWLRRSKILPQYAVSATCATPPHLEGAPLFDIPTDSLNCAGEENSELASEYNETLGNRNSEKNLISLKNFHFSPDYGLILTWTVKLNENFVCNSILIYREEAANELLIANSSVSCESKVIDEEDLVSVIVPNSSNLILNESYRFCLVLHTSVSKLELKGYSNITILMYNRNSTKLGDTSQTSTNDFTNLTVGNEYVNITKHPGHDVNQKIDFIKKSAMLASICIVGFAVVILIIWILFKIKWTVFHGFISGATLCCPSKRITSSTELQRGNRYSKLQCQLNDIQMSGL